ncbi:hypothetical protein [Acetobacter thailandicus]|uniref:hypothetical protein n=1 Tax=Acetobacter thailandicus TaxID=1502842 RepID=UPI001BAE3DBC|nr:hypothetical protein [Acetobacter thailandicus]MBS0959810.1 hypothetical protein [Acetobacter thailandicus]
MNSHNFRAMAGWIAGCVVNAFCRAADNELVQALFGIAFMLCISLWMMFTATGEAVTGDLIAALLSIISVFFDIGRGVLS